MSHHNGRRLTSGEMVLARNIFGGSINYGNVTIYHKRYWIQTGDWVMTPNGNIYAPTTYEADYSGATVVYGRRSLFIHEMVHVWQYQNNVTSIVFGAIFARLSSPFSYGSSVYAYDLDRSKDLMDYSMERQAAIIEDYFRITEGRSPDNQRKTSGSPRSLADYQAVLAKFLLDPLYAKDYMFPEEDESEGD